jgi:lysyl-tRNA synthetase class 2
MRIAQSSHVQAHEYDPESQTLLVQFTNGAMYRYAGVDQTTYDSFSQSSSPGSYLHAKIKGSYPSEMVSAGQKRSRR